MQNNPKLKRNYLDNQTVLKFKRNSLALEGMVKHKKIHNEHSSLMLSCL
jgi:hypothetical protein